MSAATPLLRAAHAAIPALQACVWEGDDLHVDEALGEADDVGTPVTPHTRFDVASVTKVVATTTVAWAALGRGAIALDDPLSRFVPHAPPWAAAVSLRALLAHRSGLPAWSPFFADPDVLAAPDPDARRAAFFRALARVGPDATPPVRRYSDLGFLWLGRALEVVGGARLDACAAPWLAALGLTRTAFRPLGEVVAPDAADPIPRTGRVRPRPPAPGQSCTWASALEPTAGVVDDDNAWALGGVAGHAGLFSTARDLARFGRAVLEELDGAGRLGPPSLAAALLAPDRPDLAPPRALGFDRGGGPGSTAGVTLGRGPRGCVGHLGFVGASLWIDLDRRRVVALCTNRTLPGRADPPALDAIRALRPALGDLPYSPT